MADHEEVRTMAYSSESFMVSEKEAMKIRLKEILNRERREKLKMVFDQYVKEKLKYCEGDNE